LSEAQHGLNLNPVGVNGSGTLDPDDFSVFLGLASWLMTMSKEHRDQPISRIDRRVLPGLLLKQFKLIRREKMPVAFLSWASVSDEIKARMEADIDFSPDLKDWRSGPRLVIVECISPFLPTDKIRQEFINKFNASV
jgi:hemolysin-activating ACP:hemolysin acyltransferase